jgi:hypothetical protein
MRMSSSVDPVTRSWCGHLTKRLKGLEPSTFCMASSGSRNGRSVLVAAGVSTKNNDAQDPPDFLMR